MDFQKLRVGNVVRAINDASPIHENMIGVVYDRYRFASYEGVSILFENGQCVGWDEKTFSRSAKAVLHCVELENYHFKSMEQISNDFALGLFSSGFEMAAHPAGLGENSLLW